MAGSGTGVLMDDLEREAVRDRTWHRGGFDLEREARTNQGSAR